MNADQLEVEGTGIVMAVGYCLLLDVIVFMLIAGCM